MFVRKQPAALRRESGVRGDGLPLTENADDVASGLSPGAMWLEYRSLALAVGLDWRLCADKVEQRNLRMLWKRRGMAGLFEATLPGGALLMAPCPVKRTGAAYSASAFLGLHLTQGIVVANLELSGVPGAGFWVCRISGGRPVPGCDLLLPDLSAAEELMAAWLDDSLQPTSVYGDVQGAAMSTADLLSEIEVGLRTGLYSAKDIKRARLRLLPTSRRLSLWWALLPLSLLVAGLAYGWWVLEKSAEDKALASVSVSKASVPDPDAERRRLEEERLARVRADLQKRFDADVQAAQGRLQDRLQVNWADALMKASATPLRQQGAQVNGFRCLYEAQLWRCSYDWRSQYALSRTRLLGLGVQVTGAKASLLQFSTQREFPHLPPRREQPLWPVGLSDAHVPLWLADLFQGLRFGGIALSPPTDEVLAPASYEQDGVILGGEPVTVARYHPVNLVVPVSRKDVLYVFSSLPMVVDEFEMQDGRWMMKARLVGPLTLNP